MHKYSTFEQVGPLGHTITSHDVEMTTSPGDIVLYSSNQIVVFFGTNTWGYTKLGHIKYFILTPLNTYAPTHLVYAETTGRS